MDIRHTVRLLALLCLVSAGGVVAGSIQVGREFRVPTRYTQHPPQIRDGFVTGPASIPTDFVRRFEGVGTGDVTVRTMPGVRKRYTTENGQVLPAYQVRFTNGREALFVQGLITSVFGERWLGLGVRNEEFYIRNERTGEVVVFREPS